MDEFGFDDGALADFDLDAAVAAAAPPPQPAASAPQKPAAAQQTETSPPTSPPEEEPDFDDVAAQDAFAQDLTCLYLVQMEALARKPATEWRRQQSPQTDEAEHSLRPIVAFVLV